MSTFSRSQAPWEQLAHRIETTAALDAPAKTVGSRVRGAIPSGPVKDALSGTWLGHALHPMLTDVVIGSFTSATVLDVLGGEGARAAARKLIGLGIVAYPPTALTGVNDWADTETADPAVRRTGLVHAGTNALALSLYTVSLLARRRGRGGRASAFAGAAVLMLGGYLGGHLSLRRGVGPDQTVFDPGPTDWTRAADASQLPDGKLTRVVVEDTPVVLLRDADEVFALHDRCSHRGCSLAEGESEDGAITCACHGSRFDRRDGGVLRGPATAPQPAFQVRVRDDVVEIRRPDPAAG